MGLAPLAGMRLHRIYFYDSAPLQKEVEKPLGGGSINFGATPVATHSTQTHRALSQIPFVSLRLGELAFRGWKVKQSRLTTTNGDSALINASHLTADISQKGVDMRIGLDIAALTLKKHVEVIVLVTADSDFIPAMKFARREGAQLFLVHLGHGVMHGMLEHADVVIEIPSQPHVAAQS